MLSYPLWCSSTPKGDFLGCSFNFSRALGLLWAALGLLWSDLDCSGEACSWSVGCSCCCCCYCWCYCSLQFPQNFKENPVQFPSDLKGISIKCPMGPGYGIPLDFKRNPIQFPLDLKGRSIYLPKESPLDFPGVPLTFQRGYPSISFRFPLDFKGDSLQLPLVGARTSYMGAGPPPSACTSQAHHNFIRNMVRTSQAPPEAETPLQLTLHTHNICDWK